jgi:hypothetical protein
VDQPKTPVSVAVTPAATPAKAATKTEEGDDDDGGATGGNEAPFDKKAYNAAVRAAKAFSAANDHEGALREYQKALAARPGHDGVTKKVKSLQKKLGK